MEPLERIYDDDYYQNDSDSLHGSDTSEEGEGRANNESQPQGDRMDDFESEMQGELSRLMDVQEEELLGGPSTSGEAHGGPSGEEGTSGRRAEGQQQEEDDDDDDDDDDDEEYRGEGRVNRPVDAVDPFYDPEIDEDDAAWEEANRRRQMYAQQNQDAPLPNSDAVLNCPACMTLLSRDCQAHATIRSQYRAMFVINCTVDWNRKIRVPRKNQRNKRKRRRVEGRRSPTSSEEEGDEERNEFHPVFCTYCSTHVAMIDQEEVYHFGNVLASQC